MSPGAILGMILMLGAVVWCLASLTRVIIGPRRKAALVRSGQSVLVFFTGAIIVGTFGGRLQERAATPAGTAVVTATEARTPPPPRQEIIQTTLPSTLPPEASVRSAVAIPTVAARYQTSPTLVSLVVAGFDPASSETLREIATAECAGADFCSIGFWTDDALAPRKLRMSDETINARLAHYVHSQATGLDAFKWNCDIFSSSDNCL